MNRGLARGLPREMPSFRGLGMNGPLRSVYFGENQSALATTTDCVVIGDGAGGFTLRGATSGVYIGSQAGGNQVDQNGNVFIGYQAGLQNNSSQNVCIGYLTAVGSAGTGGGNSVVIGYNAFCNGGAATVVGQGAGSYAGNTACTSIGQGTFSVAGGTSVGFQAGHLQSGTTAINTFVGFQSGYTPSGTNATTTATGQTCLGTNSGQASATQVNNITAVGNGATVGAAGGIAIGCDSAGTGATTSVADEIVFGTALSGTKLGNISGLTATTGHVYIPLVAGTPTGVPVAKTGYAAHLFDSTAGKLWAYYGAAWHFVTLT